MILLISYFLIYNTIISGKYFDNSKVTTPGVPAVPGQPINFSDADWLWTTSEKLTGKPFVV